MKTFLSMVILFSSYTVHADSCEKFNGRWDVVPHGCKSGTPGKMTEDQTYSQINISFNLETQMIAITYFFSEDDHFLIRYIVDGKEHSGDDSGRSYLANCTHDQLTATRTGVFKFPLTTTFTLDGERVSYVEKSDGDDFTRVCELQ